METPTRILILAEEARSLVLTRKELIQELLLRGATCDVSVPVDKHCDTLRELGCTILPCVFDRRSTNPINDIRLLRYYIKLLDKGEYDVVLSYSIKPNIYGGFASRLKKVPFCINITGMGSALNNAGLVRIIVLFMYRRVGPYAKAVFFENSSNQSAFFEWEICTANNSYVLPGAGVNLCDYEYKKRNTERNGTVFLFIGRIMPEKGMNELCEVARRLYKEKYEAVVKIAGDFDDSFQGTFEQNYSSIPNLQLLGYCENIKDQIEQADCIVLPSYHEGMANVLLEGGAVGRPLLASDIPGCREAIVDGQTGFLFRPKDVDSLYSAMLQFIQLNEEERDTFGYQSRKHIESTFDRTKVVHEVADILFSQACRN